VSAGGGWAVTIIGLPLALANLKLIPVSAGCPWAKEIVPVDHPTPWADSGAVTTLIFRRGEPESVTRD